MRVQKKSRKEELKPVHTQVEGHAPPHQHESHHYSRSHPSPTLQCGHATAQHVDYCRQPQYFPYGGPRREFVTDAFDWRPSHPPEHSMTELGERGPLMQAEIIDWSSIKKRFVLVGFSSRILFQADGILSSHLELKLEV
jgi:hypothetical protein